MRYGTKNKFTSSNIQKRWNTILEITEVERLRIHGYSTDVDTRMLKVMETNIKLPTCTRNCFQAAISFDDPLLFQDTVHISTKLNPVFLKEDVVAPIAGYFDSPIHLEHLLETHSKDKHLLTKPC